ncbi:hypothetical protein [Rhizobium sp.]|uniref:hypothetical protein n=1 Tax=Rhizobium sp. TaxID=391 RepID=UPI00289D3990
MMKAISHIPLGIFSIISGYEEHPKEGQWVLALQAYKQYIINVQKNNNNIIDLGREDKIWTDAMLVSGHLVEFDTRSSGSVTTATPVSELRRCVMPPV